MAIEVNVKKTEPVTVAFVAKKGSYDQIPQAFPELYAWTGQKGFIPSGPPIGVYYNNPSEVPVEELMWEIQSPISGDVAPSGPDEKGLGVKKLDGAEVAFAMHKGPFDQVGPVWSGVVRWIVEQGYEIAGPGQEVYLSDPATTAPSDLLTEIRFPVSRK